MSTYTCKVISEPVYCEGECRFQVETEKETYTVLSKDTQAAKDYIFVDREQIMVIEGNIVGSQILLNKGRIILNKV